MLRCFRTRAIRDPAVGVALAPIPPYPKVWAAARAAESMLAVRALAAAAEAEAAGAPVPVGAPVLSEGAVPHGVPRPERKALVDSLALLGVGIEPRWSRLSNDPARDNVSIGMGGCEEGETDIGIARRGRRARRLQSRAREWTRKQSLRTSSKHCRITHPIHQLRHSRRDGSDEETYVSCWM